jgi:hypothetical protein
MGTVRRAVHYGASLTFKNEGGKTKYTDRETHEKIGFHQDWGQCADQLVALVTKS